MKKFVLLLFVLTIGLQAIAQVSINVDNSIPNPSAMLDVKSSNRGLLPPRMTHSEINAIVNPANGLIVYCTDCGVDGNGAFFGFINGTWNSILTCIPPLTPATGVNVPSENQVIWNWNTVPGATGYRWNTTTNYATATDVGVATTKTETGLTCNTPYARYAWAYNSCGISAPVILSQATSYVAPAAPVTGTHTASPVQIVWNWNTVIGATGYKWNTTSNYGTATDMGMVTTKTETGLSCNTAFTRYVWAYSACGNSLVTTLTQSTSMNGAASVSITVSANPVCSGTSVTFTATPVNGGATPTWQWIKNGNNISGATNATYSCIPVSNDAISCQMTSSIPCSLNNPATSNTITMTVNPLLPVTVSITASANPVCAGTSVTFTATPVNGGATPAYQWKKGGTAITGATNVTYSYIPLNGDAITCQLTSNATCPSGNPATSNTVTMTVNPLQIVGVSIVASANPVCAGTSVTFTATPSNGGTTPLYQWKKGGTAITGATNATYSYTPVNADALTCVLTSTAACTSGNPATSNAVTMTVNPLLPVTVSIAASTNPVCAGTSVTFTATPGNGGTSPAYQWKKGGTAITGATNAAYSYVPVNADAVTCVLTSNATCTSGNPATSNTVTISVNPLPVAPVAGTHVPSETQVVWNWNAVAGATGYKWNSTDNYGTATDFGTAITNTETGLTCNTSYTRYIWAYNACGNSTSTALNQTTLACPISCGLPLTINHIAGTVAPVAKTTTYGTVTNIPGEPAKCWITSNLGSDHQATAVNDATEASAGWFWQFNRKQGYKHDGTTRTPNTTWITSISETADWATANDPCNIELGSDWRIPTSTEWINVDAAGNWTDWTGPWNSGLKLHAAGYLDYTDGSVGNRGHLGYCWSSAQSNVSYAWMIRISSSSSAMVSAIKAYGFPIRCLKDCASASIPTSGTHLPTQTQIIWNWNAVIGATGYKWNATNDYANATDMGTATTRTETGLTCNTAYTRYVWAYNTCGNSTPVALTQSTLACSFTCGSSITIDHVAGVVAPVSKTTTYGTVTNIPGEPAKCWITSNLGSDHQATAVSDDTEHSAGWYWQFNRKQGYKHDGTTRTPNTTWITSISETSDWITANDPCNIELGTTWHLPTYTEWYNVSNTGSWTNWTGPWDSGLKLHAAGDLYYSYGDLYNRGSVGFYWSSSQNGPNNGRYLQFNSGSSSMSDYGKNFGFSVRCLTDGCISVPTAPTLGTHQPSQTQVIWNWNTVAGADGYKWNTTSDYATATDMGTSTTRTETGLTCGTAYTRYAWAYNSCGNSTPVALTQSTLACSFTCGSSITMNHVAGEVAPVSKTTTYGTVTNIPGESAKCWITSNLGSDHQANAESDATEASAGWYWQFNRMQGYKHDGLTPSPAWTITSINESIDWQTVNDPCNLELGSNWRLPTSTEWYNVDNSGGWNNWNGPWDSGLKLHAAGLLWMSDGSLNNRGSRGYYWSSTQYDATSGWFLNFYSSASNMDGYSKANGMSVRCVREN